MRLMTAMLKTKLEKMVKTAAMPETSSAMSVCAWRLVIAKAERSLTQTYDNAEP